MDSATLTLRAEYNCDIEQQNTCNRRRAIIRYAHYQPIAASRLLIKSSIAFRSAFGSSGIDFHAIRPWLLAGLLTQFEYFHVLINDSSGASGWPDPSEKNLPPPPGRFWPEADTANLTKLHPKNNIYLYFSPVCLFMFMHNNNNNNMRFTCHSHE